MENANDIYALIGKDKKSPGQWLALKTTKSFMKSTKTKYKKDEDVYLMDEDLLKEYESYLKGQKEEIKKESPLLKPLISSIGEKNTHVFFDFFVQRVCGLSYSKLRKEMEYSKADFIDACTPQVKLFFTICSNHIQLLAQREKVVPEAFVKAELVDVMQFCESRGARASYKTILDDDNYRIEYAKVTKK